MSTALIIGSGPNGLAAAARLARAGVEVTVVEASAEIGGGTRSSDEVLPGLIVDHCSAFHPMALVSPIFKELQLERHGLAWRWAELECAHPLDDGTAPALYRGAAETAASLGPDARRWNMLFARSAEGFEKFADDILAPVVRLPHHPLRMARFGLPALLPASWLARVFHTEAARSLFAGVAVHTMHPLERPLTSAIPMGLITAAHSVGWPVAEGGSGAIGRALTSLLVEHGAKIETGVQISSITDLAPADVTIFDLAPAAVADILGYRQPRGAARAYRRFKPATGAFKVDFAVAGGVPWSAENARRAGTVHVGGSLKEMAAAERATYAGQMPQRPFVLVGQQYLADPQRSDGTTHPVYAYAHVPYGYTGDATSAIIAQIERFAPGFRDGIIAMHVTRTNDFEHANLNFIGGDIITGAKTARQLVLGPRPGHDPYRTGVAGMFLCSAATPPGPGAHGMGGAHAASGALRYLERHG
ncbi:MAG: NAD(P)/FAD-dependent oxidoreductase [Actinomycetota bacterium]|nr:NAD(P)/FAD-dependent oxidoreductase [Actinomycetota bacterium]